MLRKKALDIAAIVTGLGILFVALNILDIHEDYRLNLPIAAFNTIFVSAVAVLVACLAARTFLITDSPEILGLGSAVLSFGVGILIYGWFTRAVLEVRISVYDIAILILALVHLCGLTAAKFKLSAYGLKSRSKLGIVISAYLIVIAVIAVLTWLLNREVLHPLVNVRDLSHGISAIICLVAAGICFMNYRKSRSSFYYWYALGLILFIFGLLFYSQGSLQSKLAWLGRVSQYVGYVYFLVAAFGAYRQAKKVEAQ